MNASILRVPLLLTCLTGELIASADLLADGNAGRLLAGQREAEIS